MNTTVCDYCSKEYPKKNIREHGNNCKYKPHDCKYNCGIRVYRSQLLHHESEECTKRMNTCPACKLQYPFNVRNHEETCPKIFVPCPELCGIGPMRREHVVIHLAKFCSKLMSPCIYTYAGCQVMGNAETLKQHVDNDSAVHIKLLETKLIDTQNLIKANEIATGQSIKQLADAVERMTLSRKEFANEKKMAKETQKRFMRVLLNFNQAHKPIPKIKEILNEIDSLKSTVNQLVILNRANLMQNFEHKVEEAKDVESVHASKCSLNNTI